LESKELVGDYISIKKIRKDYGEPTEIYETDYDTGESVYYYGNIKLTFENVVTLESWVGKELNKLSDNY